MAAPAGAGPADAGPQVRFGVALVIGRIAQFVLPPGSRGAGVQGPAADRLPGAVIEPGNQALRGGPGFGLGGADDDVGPVAEPELAAVAGGAGSHVRQDGPDSGQRVGPHQKHVRGLGGDLAGCFGQAAEIERRAAAPDRAQPRRVQCDVHEFTVEVDWLAVEQVPQNLYDLQGAAVPGSRFQALAGQVGGDDIDRQAPVEQLIDRGELPSELRRPHLPHPHRDQQLHPAQQRGDPGGERDRVDAHRVARRQQQVVVSGLFRAERDVAAVFPARLQPAIRHAEKLVIVVAQRGKP
jgi:hypothetical protein